MSKALRAAATLAAPLAIDLRMRRSEQLRIDAGGRDETLDASFDTVVAGYQEIIEHARPLGVVIIIENHWGPTHHPDAMQQRLAAVPGLLFDSYNWPQGTHKPGANASNLPG